MNDNKNNEDRTMQILTDLIDDLFSTHYNKETKMQAEPMKSAPVKEQSPTLYESIQDYTNQTGKRFRMTKEQKSRNLSREQAFNETFGGKN